MLQFRFFGHKALRMTSGVVRLANDKIMMKKLEIIRSVKMILILICLLLILTGYVMWYFLTDTEERFVKYKMVKKNNTIVYEAVNTGKLVFMRIKNFFGERFLRRLPISRASSKESEIAQAGKNIKTAGR